MKWTRINSDPITTERTILVERDGKIGQVRVIRNRKHGTINFGTLVFEELDQLDEFDRRIERVLDREAEIVD